MDDPDLQLLRSFRLDEAEPPAGMQERIEERLWQSILDEEAQRAGRRAPRREGWLSGLLRPALAGSMALVLAIGVAVVSDGGNGGSTIAGAGVTEAGTGGVLDRTASTLFGSEGTAARGPVVGTIDLTDDDSDDALVDGPQHDSFTAQLQDRSMDLVEALPRDPERLRGVVRDALDDAGYDDPSDAYAFRVAMRWIVDPSVPVDLRSAMLRSLAGLSGIDEARTGVDVLGRGGIVLGHLDQLTGVRTQVVLHAADGTLREVRSFTTTYVDPACEPGTFVEHDVYEEDGSWVDPASRPWVDWPLVVEACGGVSG